MIKFLLKISNNKDHLEKIVSNGEIYFNFFEYFRGRKGEQEAGVGDKHEGYDHYSCGKGDIIRLNGRDFNIVNEYSFNGGKTFQYTHIFCTIGITDRWAVEQSHGFPLHGRLSREFGDYAVLIYNPSEFLNRIFFGLKSQKILYEHGMVEYFDGSKYRGELGIFKKLNTYQYQNEYRIAISGSSLGLYKPIMLKLGDLSDIAYGPCIYNDLKFKIKY